MGAASVPFRFLIYLHPLCPYPDSPKVQPPPSPTSSTRSLTSFHTCNTSFQHNKAHPELFSPIPSSQNKWPSPPPLPQGSPRIRTRHNLRNYTSLASTNRSQKKHSSTPPLDSQTSTSLYMTLHYSTMSLLHSTWLYITLPCLYYTLLSLPWFYFILLYSISLHHGSTSFYLTLPYSTLALLQSTFSTLLYHGPTSHYLTLHLYHGSTSLYLTLHSSTMALLPSTSFYITLH